MYRTSQTQTIHLPSEILRLRFDPNSTTFATLDPVTGRPRRSFVWRCRRRALVSYVKSWRPRLHVHIMLLPKTQRRLASLEIHARRLEWSIKDLDRKLNEALAERPNGEA